MTILVDSFHGVQAVDLKSFPLAEYFQESADWMESILKKGGVIFVHCVQVRILIYNYVTLNNVGKQK